ncbi:MAG: IS481 family transposase [Patescibacteria group bacterium]
MSGKEIIRLQKWRLGILHHVEELTHNVTKTCRYYGIGRTAYYEWLKRYQEEGEDGLRDKSRRPHHSPMATQTEIVAKIVYLRQNYHFGPLRIKMYLKRYHDIGVNRSTVYKILKRLNMNLLPVSKRYRKTKDRWIRYEKPQPGHRLQVDVKFLERIKDTRRRYYQFTAIDDCTRLRILRIYDKNNQLTAIQFLDYVFSRLPFHTEVVQTDNGSEFQAQFHWHILDKGIKHVYIRPRTPRLNGKVERSHRIDEEEFYRMLEGVVIDDANLFNEKLQEWENFYNFERPHSALNGQTPYERFREKAKL